MPYVTPPTFVDDAVLSAAQLNILSADVEYLYGLVQGSNIPFAANSKNGDLTSDVKWIIRHRHQYLHVKVTETGAGGAESTTAEGNGVKVYYDDDLVGGPSDLVEGGTVLFSIDLDASAAAPLTEGNWYEIYVAAVNDVTWAPSARFNVEYIYESEAA
jgi:hypothetical protein